MKNYAKVLVFAAIVALIVVPAQAASGMCDLISQMDRIFRILRVLAFLGAGFYIAGWAWEYISAGKVDMAKTKERGIGLLVGFSLLFIIGVVISFLLNAAAPGGSLDCQAALVKFGTTK